MCQCHSQSSCSKGGCGCHGGSGSCPCSCHQKGSTCGSEVSSHSHSEKFLELADQAWMEVLKEKIKENIRSNAKHLDELAGIIAEANHERWKKKMDTKKCCGNFEEKLNHFFGQTCSDSSCKK